jgi:hypothetical protein
LPVFETVVGNNTKPPSHTNKPPETRRIIYRKERKVRAKEREECGLNLANCTSAGGFLVFQNFPIRA